MPQAMTGHSVISPPRVMIGPYHGVSITKLNKTDVLFGLGGRIYNSPGNVAFRREAEDYKREYLRAHKLEKIHVAARLVAKIRNKDPPGRFLRKDPTNPGKYVEMGDEKAWNSECHALLIDTAKLIELDQG